MAADARERAPTSPQPRSVAAHVDRWVITLLSKTEKKERYCSNATGRTNRKNSKIKASRLRRNGEDIKSYNILIEREEGLR